MATKQKVAVKLLPRPLNPACKESVLREFTVGWAGKSVGSAARIVFPRGPSSCLPPVLASFGSLFLLAGMDEQSRPPPCMAGPQPQRRRGRPPVARCAGRTRAACCAAPGGRSWRFNSLH